MARGYACDYLHQASVFFQDLETYTLTEELHKKAVLSEMGVKK